MSPNCNVTLFSLIIFSFALMFSTVSFIVFVGFSRNIFAVCILVILFCIIIMVLWNTVEQWLMQHEKMGWYSVNTQVIVNGLVFNHIYFAEFSPEWEMPFYELKGACASRIFTVYCLLYKQWFSSSLFSFSWFKKGKMVWLLIYLWFCKCPAHSSCNTLFLKNDYIFT